MAQSGAAISRQTKIALTISLVVLVFFLELPSDAASWAQAGAEHKLLEGFTALNVLGVLYRLSSLARDAHRWLTGIRVRNRGSPSPSPAELERGHGHGQALEKKAAAELPPQSSEPSTLHWRTALLSIVERLTLLAFHAISLLGVLFHSKVVSLQKPLMDNIAHALLFVLWGLEVLSVALLLVVLGGWLAGAVSLSTAEGEAEGMCGDTGGARLKPSSGAEKVSESSEKD